MADTIAAAPDSGELRLQFLGKADEYFRIWIVNLCLTVLTLGVFSAWAKVRKKRYFYSHTRIDGTPMQYLGQPLPILKGRIVAVLLFGIYYFSEHLFTGFLPVVMLAVLFAAPWVMVRSAAFNARYSAYRNITFQFHGEYWPAFRVLSAWGVLPALAVGNAFQWWGNPLYAAAAYGIFGLVFPWWLRGFKAFIVEHTSYGAQEGQLHARGGQFFRIYFVGGLIITLAALPAGAVVGVLSAKMLSSRWIMLTMLPIYAAYVLGFAYIQAHSANLVWNSARLGPLAFRSSLKGRGMAALYFTNALGIVASLGLAIPWAVIRTMRYRAEHLQIALEGEISAFQGSGATAVQATGAEIGELFDLDVSL